MKEDVLEVPQEKKTSKKLIIFITLGIIFIVLAIFGILSYAYFAKDNGIPHVNLTNNNSGMDNHPQNTFPMPDNTPTPENYPQKNHSLNTTKQPSGNGGSSGSSGSSGGNLPSTCTDTCVSLGYPCGNRSVCGVLVNCGKCLTCSDDEGCTVIGSSCEGSMPYSCALNASSGCLIRTNGSACGANESCIWGSCIKNTKCVLCKDLVLYFPFDKQADSTYKTVYDYSDYSNNGVAFEDAKFTSNGKYRGAFDFDGYNDFISVESGKGDSLNFTNNFTVSLWYKTRSKSDLEYIITSGQWASGGSGFGITYSTADNRIYLNLGNGSAWKYDYMNIDLEDNDWHYLTVVYIYNGQNWGDSQFYIDGTRRVYKEGDLNMLSGTSISGNGIGVGGFWAGANNNINGTLDELVIYKKALNDTEITQLYDSSVNQVLLENQPVVYYRFNGDTKDSRSSHDGGAIGTPSYTEGIEGSAFDFSGSNHVNLGNINELNGAKQLSISLWIKPKSTGRNYILLSKYDGTTGFELEQKNREVLFSHNFNGSGLFSGDILHPDLWQYVVVTWNGTHQKIYVGSRLISSRQDSTPSLINLNTILVGAGNGGINFEGAIDELKIYNRELSLNEITREYGGFAGNGLCEGGENWKNALIDCSFYCKPGDSPLECGISCSSDNDCKDSFSLTEDTCINPATSDSYCRHKLTRNAAWCAGSFTDLRWPGAGRIPDEMIDNCDFHADLLYTPGQNQSDLFAWLHGKEKIVIAPVHINDLLYKIKIPTEEFQTNKEYWIQNISSRSKEPLEMGYDGIVYDEIRLPGDNPPMSVVSIVLQRLKKQYPTKIIAVYGGKDMVEVHNNDPAKMETMRRFFTFPDIYLPEIYLSEDVVDIEGFSISEYFRGLLEGISQFYPEAWNKMIFLAESGEEHDKKPSVDFNKFLDEQFYIAKNLTNRKYLRGLGSFGAFSTKLESNYWIAKMMKHYILEDNNTSLSDRNYMPVYLQNPGFDNGVSSWQVSSIADGIVEAKNITEIDSNLPQPQYVAFGPSRKIPNGKQVLYMKRGSSPNTITQTANIESGKNYYLEVWSKKHSGDFDLSNVKVQLINPSGNSIAYSHTRLSVCTGISALAYGYLFSECNIHLEGNAKYYYWTKDEFVFNASQNQVKIVITDENASQGEISLVDFVQLQEYAFPYDGGSLPSLLPHIGFFEAIWKWLIDFLKIKA